MIFISILLSAGGAIILSETLGRGQVVYTRLMALVGFFVACCAAAGYVVTRQGGGMAEFAAILLSGVPIMAAWLGFRIHVSNSITLEMAELIADGRPRTLDEIGAVYDVDGHTARRVDVLREGGYLAADADASVIDSPKSRAILAMIRIVCGPDGPQSVAEFLRQRDRQGDAKEAR